MSERQVTFIEAINAALTDAMDDDRRVLVLGEDVADPEGGGIVGVTRGLSTRFGDMRVRSTPISEQAIIGAAIGASLAGYRPVAEIMLMNFTTVAMDMIVNHAAKLRFMSGGQTSVPIVIRTVTGAGRQTGGQHADFLEAWFAHTAGMKVVVPSTPMDVYGLMRSCIDDPDPCLFVETVSLLREKGPLPPRGTRIPLGKGRVVHEGTDVTVISYARVALEAVAAAAELSKQGISVEVIDLRSVQPWDRPLVLQSVRKTKRALVAHEATKEFGAGGEIAATISEELFGSLRAPVRRVGAPFCPVPFSKPLEQAFAVSRGDIVNAVVDLMKLQSSEV